jgi:hypothetical protein
MSFIQRIIIIIIIIIWQYNPLWVFAFSAKSLQVPLSLAVSFQFLIFSFLRSFMTSYCHRCLVLPTGLVPRGFQSNSFLVGLAWSSSVSGKSYLSPSSAGVSKTADSIRRRHLT